MKSTSSFSSSALQEAELQRQKSNKCPVINKAKRSRLALPASPSGKLLGDTEIEEVEKSARTVLPAEATALSQTTRLREVVKSESRKNQWGCQYGSASYYGPIPHGIIVRNTQSWLSKVVAGVHPRSFCLNNFCQQRPDYLSKVLRGRTVCLADKKQWHSWWSLFTLYRCFWEGESPIKNAWEMGADVTLNMLPAAEILVHRSLREG